MESGVGCSLYRIGGWASVGPGDFAVGLRGLWVAFVGEVHERPWMVRCEVELLRALAAAGAGWLGLEHFNYEQQGLLDAWLEGRLSWEGLLREYSRGPEGFDLEAYKPLLEEARRLGLRVYGVMPPRTLAARVARGGLQALEGHPGLPLDAARVRLDYEGYAERFLELIPRHGPMTRLDPRLLLQAQAFKDEVIAELAARHAEAEGPGVVVAGWAHVEHHGTAPTRLGERLPNAIVRVSTARDAPPGQARRDIERAAAKGILLASHAATPAAGPPA